MSKEQRIFISLNKKVCEPIFEEIRKIVTKGADLNLSNAKIVEMALREFLKANNGQV